MNYNYEYLFFKYLYNELELNKLDQELENNNIKMVDQENVDKRISKYFSLLNRGNEANFSDLELETYKRIFSLKLDKLMEPLVYEEAISFIKSTYQKYYHLTDEVKYIYYGPENDEFLAPSNCIALGLNYIKYDIGDENFDAKLAAQEDIIFKVRVYIQRELAKEKNIKLASLAFNEVSLNQPFISL